MKKPQKHVLVSPFLKRVNQKLFFNPCPQPEGCYKIVSVHPSVCPSVQAFSWNCIMIFPEFWHGARDPYEVASDSQISLTNLGKWTKNGLKTGFFDLKDLVIGFYRICSIMKTISLTIDICRNGTCLMEQRPSG